MGGNEELPLNNGAVLNISQIIKAVMSSVAEAELGGLFINAKTAVAMQKTLENMGHPQPPTPIQTDNSTAQGELTNKISPQGNQNDGDAQYGEDAGKAIDVEEVT